MTSTRSSTSRRPAPERVAASRLRGLLAVVHPFPSALNSIVVLALVTFAGGSVVQAVVLAASMLLMQFAIGSANDWFDADLDAKTKPSKPIAAGLISRRAAGIVALTCGTGGLVLAAVAPGVTQPQTALVAALILLVGLVYDALLKRTPLSWLAFSAAFPLLLVFAWSSVPGFYPPAGTQVLVVAVLAGPALQLANGVVDLERDRSFGLRTLPVVLGHRVTLLALTILQLGMQSIVWLTLRTFTTWLPLALAAGIALAGGMSLAGVVLSAASRASIREQGWRLQALGLALLVICWTLLRQPDEEPGG